MLHVKSLCPVPVNPRNIKLTFPLAGLDKKEGRYAPGFSTNMPKKPC
jgi:hypothetical protein